VETNKLAKPVFVSSGDAKNFEADRWCATREMAVEACMYESNDGIERRSKGCLAEEQRQDGPVINRCRTQPAPLLEPASAARQRWGRFFWRS
jgi:hypothetical protein